MKVVIGLCTMMLCLGIDGAQAAEPRKHALLVGIGKYRNLPPLPGATHDVANMKDLLVKTMGFPERAVVTLENEAATRAAILGQLEQLIQRVAAQDTAVFHFSGHGSQRADSTQDEEDGLDETLVPYDSRDPGIYDISDDEINQLLIRLTERCGNVTFIFDSCHSGTGQRAGVFRKVEADLRKTVMASTAPPQRQKRPFGGVQAENYVMIAACTSTQVAGEIDVDGQRQGALTHYLAKALRQTDGTTTWNQLLEEVRLGVRRHFRGQTPVIHGRGDRVIFGLQEIPTQGHIPVSPGKDQALVLAAGRVHGLTNGSVFELFSRKKGLGKQAIGRAKLIEVGDFSSRALLLAGGPVSEGDWALESAHAYTGKRLLLYLQKPVPKLLVEELGKAASAALVQEPSKAHLLIEHDPGNHRIVLKDRDGIVMGTGLPDDNLKAASSQILGWHRFFNVLAIESEGPAAPKMSFAIVKRGAEATVDSASSDSHEQVFREGDKLVLRAGNLSRQKIFFTLLALSSSGEIVQLYPASGEDQPTSPGATLELSLDATLSKGYEKEKTVVKLFATLQRIDLSFLEQPGGKRRGDNPHPLEALVDQGIRAGTMPPPRWTARDKVLVIVKPGKE